MSQFYDQASLVMVPSGYKSGKIYSQKPLSTSGELSFSRASNATRVNSSGLVEKVRTNLALQSNTFSNATWIKTDVSVASGQSGYDGTSNAWLLSATASSGNLVQAISFSGVNTLSFYAKQGTLQYVYILLNGGGFNGTAAIDLADGTIYNASVFLDSIKTTNVGGGWFRIEAVSSRSNSDFRIYPSNNNSGGTTATGNIYIQDAQVETGDIATDYIATTSAAVSVGPVSGLPRLDYSGGASCPSLLLEGQRTNLALWSEQFNNAGWTNAATTITANYGVSPDGYTNADRFQQTTIGALQQTISVTASTAYTVSFYCKLLGGTSASLGVYNFAAGNFIFQDNLFSSLVLNEWVRVTRTFTTPVGCTLITGELWRDSTIDCLVYGFQLEAGAYATSYIPTLSSAVTRVADAASKTGISSLIGQTEGTIYGEVEKLSGAEFASWRFQLSDGTNANWIFFSLEDSYDLRMYVRKNGTTSVDLQPSNKFVNDGVYKIAMAYSNLDAVVYINGSLAASSTGAIIPSTNAFIITGSNAVPASSTQLKSGAVKQALLFQTRLSNDDLATLTTL